MTLVSYPNHRWNQLWWEAVKWRNAPSTLTFHTLTPPFLSPFSFFLFLFLFFFIFILWKMKSFRAYPASCWQQIVPSNVIAKYGLWLHYYSLSTWWILSVRPYMTKFLEMPWTRWASKIFAGFPGFFKFYFILFFSFKLWRVMLAAYHFFFYATWTLCVSRCLCLC